MLEEGRKGSFLMMMMMVKTTIWTTVLTRTTSLTLTEVRLITKLLAVNRKPEIKERRTPNELKFITI